MSRPLGSVGNVSYSVDDLDAAPPWDEERLDSEPAVKAQLVTFLVDGARLTIHRSDDLNTCDPAGVAVRWAVKDIDAFIDEWTGDGAEIGPPTTESGQSR